MKRMLSFIVLSVCIILLGCENKTPTPPEKGQATEKTSDAQPVSEKQSEPALSPYEELAIKQLAMAEETVTVMKSVTDQEKALAAQPKIANLKQQFEEIDQKMQAEEPSEETLAKFKEKYGKRLETVNLEYTIQLKRLAEDPFLGVALAPTLLPASFDSPEKGSESVSEKPPGAALDPSEKLLLEQLTTIEGITAVLKTVTDKQSALAAQPKLAELSQQMENVLKKMEAEKPSEETIAKLKEKYAERSRTAGIEYHTQMKRVAENPVLSVAFAPAPAAP